MGTTLNRRTYERLLEEDLTWLIQQPHTLERDHVEAIVKRSAQLEYTSDSSPLTAEEATIKIRGIIETLCNSEFNTIDPNEAEAAISELMAVAPSVGEATFQARVDPWLLECFGSEIARDAVDRNHRFLEEALELAQANGCSQSEAYQLVDYTFNRPAGEASQEVGGVMVTLAALCLANGLDMHDAGEAELARIWTKVETIRAKQAAKPKHSPLPAAPPSDAAEIVAEMARENDESAAAWGGDDEAGRQAGAVADALREAERRIRAAKS